MINVPIYQSDIDLIEKFDEAFYSFDGDHKTIASAIAVIMVAKIHVAKMFEEDRDTND